jgi:hypothetical protein
MDRLFPDLTRTEAASLLGDARIDVAEADIRIDRRDDRWCAILPGYRVAWFPATREGAERLELDRRILRLLERRCGFRAPRVVAELGPGSDVRTMVPGAVDPHPLYERLSRNADLARRMGRSLGLLLAEQHTRIREDDVKPWLRTRVSWPEPGSWVLSRLPTVIEDTGLIGEIEAILQNYEESLPAASELALVHGDLGVHNIAVDPATDELVGVFDYDGAAWDDRHHDFRYLLFGRDEETMLDAAIDAYKVETGRTVDRRRIDLCNAVCAFSFLAFREGVAAEKRWAGRTLAEDLQWVRHGLARLR